MDYRYTMPQGFMDDQSVPVKWRLYGIINGFWLSGKSCYGGNKFFSEKLGVGERQIRSALSQLEEEKLLRREVHGTSRNILPYGSVREAEVGVPPGGSGSSGEAEVGVPHISDSISDSIPGALEDEQRGYEVVSLKEEETTRVKKPPKYKNAKTVFSWFPRPEKNWNLNTTELSHAELLFERGEVAVRGILEFLRENEGAEFLPEVNKPSDLERKWTAIIKFAERNGL